MADLTREFRSLGLLTGDQIQAAADRFQLGLVVTAEPLGGLFGNNLGLVTTTDQWVLRGVIPSLAADVELRRERFFAQAIQEGSSLPAPWPYLIDETTDIFGWPYAIMKRLPGEVLHHQQDLDWGAVGGALAIAANDLQNITWPSFGEWDPDTDDIAPVEESAAGWFENRVSALQRRIAKTSEPLDAASIAYVNGAVRDALPAIRDFSPGYVHGDFAVSNVVIHGTGSNFVVSGIFDLGGGYVADPDENLAIALWWPTFWGRPDAGAAFLSAFRELRKPRPGQAERLRAYVIVDMLENWELGRRERQPWYGSSNTFYEWAGPLVMQVEAFLASG